METSARLRAFLGAARIRAPARSPGVLLVHGWDSDQIHYKVRSEQIAALGAVCMTFDLRGHGDDDGEFETVSREDNLNDVLQAYDALVDQSDVDPDRIALVGTSYGAYLAAIATESRHVRWLGLRAPALYPDAQWNVPKLRLDKEAIDRYRRIRHRGQDNRALAACTLFEGDALIVASERDHVIHEATIDSYVNSFIHARSVAKRVIPLADHALSNRNAQHIYEDLLLGWLARMIASSGRTRTRRLAATGSTA
ncbi:MAG: alpha/beta fold hydrolase [Variovorax sp.]